MIGKDVKVWRERNGYTQAELQIELGMKSRTSISTLENSSAKLPRTIELSLAALEIAPFLRERFGKAKGKDPKKYSYPAVDEQTARQLYAYVETGIYRE